MTSSAPALAIETIALTKKYATRTVVDALDLSVPATSVTGFIGRNGAGKTTTMRMLLGLITPTSGTGSVLGTPISRPSDYLTKVGAMIEGPSFHPTLSARDNLRVLTRLAGIDDRRIDEVLDIVELTSRAGDRFRSFSLGMKQRLGIAAALLPDPRLLLLDEPTNGLDPPGIADIRTLIRRLADAGTTVFVSSHLLAEIEQVCERLVVIDEGRLRYQGPLEGLTADTSHRVVIEPERPADHGHLLDVLLADGLDARPGTGPSESTIVVHGRSGGELNRLATAAGVTLARIEPLSTSLEHAVLELTADRKDH